MSSPVAVPRAGRVRGTLFLAGVCLGEAMLLAGSIIYVRLTAAGHLYSETEVPAAPVALVLGARVFPDGTPSPFLAARLDLAHRLYLAGKVRVVLVSGDNMAEEYNEPDAMRTYLINVGMPTEAVVADHAGFDTYDSCARALRIFGIEQLIVVTQSYHLPRAVATCRALGIAATGVGDYRVRRFSRPWVQGVIRDQLACVKTVIDLITQRDPVLEQQDSSVQDALTR